MTEEDFEKLPSIEGIRYQLVAGNLVKERLPRRVARRNDRPAAERVPGPRARCAAGAGRPGRPGRPAAPPQRRSADIGVFHKPLADMRTAIHDPSEFSHLIEVGFSR